MDDQQCFHPPSNVLGQNFEVIVSAIVQGAFFVLIARCLHVVLGRLGQPRAVSQILAGILFGPSIWPADNPIFRFLFPKETYTYFKMVEQVGQIFLVFLMGLEVDIPYMWRTKRAAAEIAGGSLVVSSVVTTVLASSFKKDKVAEGASIVRVWLYLFAILANTTTPIVVELCAFAGLATTELGRLAVSASLVNDIVCLSAVAIASSSGATTEELIVFLVGFPALCFIIFCFRVSIRVMSHFHRQGGRVKGAEMLWIVGFLSVVAAITSQLGFNVMCCSFVMGGAFPRDERIRRKLVQRLMQVVHALVFPVFFGYAGLTMDFTILGEWNGFWLVVILFVHCTLCKVLGTVATTTHLNMPLADGFILGFLLNSKAHAHVMAAEEGLWGKETRSAMLITMVLCTIVSGPAARLVLRRGRRTMLLNQAGLEWAPPDSELQLILCVYKIRHVPTMLNLFQAFGGSKEAVVTGHVMHLIELTETNATSLLYHQRQEETVDEASEVEARQISDAVSSFVKSTRQRVHHFQVCSEFEGMHEEVCKQTEELFGPIVILPFHKHKRVDGRMEVTHEGYQTVNRKVQQQACCTVAILVDRGLMEARQTVDAGPVLYNVAVLFFGGRDDREATAYASRIAAHPGVSLTMIRFVFKSNPKEHKVDVSEEPKESDTEETRPISKQQMEMHADETFLSKFFERFIATELVTYVEKHVKHGHEVVDLLKSLAEEYSLYIVGKVSHDLRSKIRRREECPELGTIGNVLASQDFSNHGSVLVIQQYGGSEL